MLANRLSVTTYFNYRKEGHKSYACPKPHKARVIHKINNNKLDTTDYIDNKLGKEEA